MKVVPLVTISVALASLVSAHRHHHKEENHDSIDGLESENYINQADNSFAIEREDQIDEDHKKKKGNDSGHEKKSHTKEAPREPDGNGNGPDNIEGELHSAETDERQGKGGKEKVTEGGKKRGKDDEKSDKKKSKSNPVITKGADQKEKNQDTLGTEQQGEEANVPTTLSKEPGQEAALADTSFDKAGSHAKTVPSEALPPSSNFAPSSSPASPSQGPSSLASSGHLSTALPSKPAASSSAATSAGSTIKAGTGIILALSAFASYYLL